VVFNEVTENADTCTNYSPNEQVYLNSVLLDNTGDPISYENGVLSIYSTDIIDRGSYDIEVLQYYTLPYLTSYSST
jgi:hypothetical protein